MGAAGTRVCELCSVGAEWRDFAWSVKQLFLFYLCSLSLQDTASSHEPLFRYNEKKQIFSSFLSILTQTFKTHGKCTSSSTDSTDSSCNNIKPTLCARIASVSDSSE